MLLVQKVYAQVSSDVNLPTLQYDSIADVLGLVLNLLIGVGVALVVIFMVWAGIQYVFSKGDPKAADSARLALTHAIIGLVIILAAGTIKLIVQNTIGAGNVAIDEVTPGF